MLRNRFLFAILLCINGSANGTPGQVINLSPQQFYDGVMTNFYNATIDVRSQMEWDSGHIQNATFVEGMAGFTIDQAKAVLKGCEGQCTHIVVYCRSGNRSGRAIALMQQAGYNGTLYNGMGVSQWTDAGYPLVDDESIDAECVTSPEKFDCPGDDDDGDKEEIPPTKSCEKLSNFEKGCSLNADCCSNICDTRFKDGGYCKAEEAMVSREKRKCRTTSSGAARGGVRCATK